MTSLQNKLKHEIQQLVMQSARVYWALLKIMVPVLIAVKALDLLGGTEVLATLLSPLMQLLGLPNEVGLVWAATMLSNIYTGLLVFFALPLDQPLSLAQTSVLGSLMLLAHSLPIEGAVAKKAGVSWRATLTLRIGGALLLGILLNLVYSHFELLQGPAQMLWQPDADHDPSLQAWAIGQIKTLISIFFIILALLSILRLLRLLGIEKLIHMLLFPLLRILGIGKDAANVTVIGTVLGLTFGAGLLIQEAQSGRISPRDIFLAMGFIGLCHSVIEDTLLILLMGADLSAILWARLAFAIICIGILARLPFVQRKSTEVTTD